MKGWMRDGSSGPYVMDQITVMEMNALIKAGGDSKEWPLRFDCRKRVWPVQGSSAEFTYYEDEVK